MIKSRKNIKILLPIVIIIWGILIYKLVDAFAPDQFETPLLVKSTFKTPKVQKKDTFKLIPIERDPFLGTIGKNHRTKPSHSVSKKTNIDWPEINYLGHVSDKNSSKSVHVLQINGREYLLETGESVMDITVIKSEEASIKLKYQGEIKEFSVL